MTRILISTLLVLLVLIIGAMLLDLRAASALEPVATATPAACIHIATADTIKVYYCEDIHLFVNQFGFMAFEP